MGTPVAYTNGETGKSTAMVVSSSSNVMNGVSAGSAAAGAAHQVI